MILRRLKAHVEKENWFAVGIDFCIVVMGVFIGIQFGNWNEGRLNDQKREQVMHRMLNQSEEATRYYLGMVELLFDHNDARLYAIRTFQSGAWAEADQEKLATGATAMGLFPSPSAPKEALDEFLRSGFSSDINNDRLREAIDSYIRDRVFLEGQTDYFRQLGEPLYYDGLSRRLEMESERQTAIDIDAKRLASDPTYMEAILRAHTIGRGIASYWYGTLLASYELCEALAEALSEECESPTPDTVFKQ